MIGKMQQMWLVLRTSAECQIRRQGGGRIIRKLISVLAEHRIQLDSVTFSTATNPAGRSSSAYRPIKTEAPRILAFSR